MVASRSARTHASGTPSRGPRLSLAQALAESPHRAADLMVRDVVTLAPDATLLSAALVLRRRNITGAPVASGGDLVGVLSQKDILGVLEGRADANLPSTLLDMVIEQVDQSYLDRVATCREVLTGVRVEEAMTTHVVTVRPDATLKEVVHRLAAHHIHRLPVVEDHKLVGIVTRTDVLRTLAQASEGESPRRHEPAPPPVLRVPLVSRAYR